MRTLIDIDKEMLENLNTIAYQRKVSRASLIREAIDVYIKTISEKEKDTPVFGILKGKSKINTLELQQKLRSEWDN